MGAYSLYYGGMKGGGSRAEAFYVTSGSVPQLVSGAPIDNDIDTADMYDIPTQPRSRIARRATCELRRIGGLGARWSHGLASLKRDDAAEQDGEFGP